MAEAETASEGDLSPAEQAFFESRGEKSEGLVETSEQKTPEKQPAKEEAAPEVKADDVKTEVDETEETVELDNKGRFVRHGAFHKERSMRKQEQEARKALEVKLSEREQAFARADERLKLLSEAMSPRQEQQQEAAPPDPETDPIGAIRWLRDQVAAAQQRTTEVAKVTEADRADQHMAQSYRADAMRFAQNQKDFGDAYGFLLNGRDAELQAFGIGDAAERMRIIHDEEKGLVARALKDRASPAERVYALAKARGYAVKEEKPADEKKPAVVEQIENIARGQSAAKSLSAAGGSPSEVLTAEALANMSEDEFAAYLEKTPRSKQRAMMGG